jgi:hypothetical protein
MDSKTESAWRRYLDESGYIEVGNTSDECCLCDGGTTRIVSINGKRYEMCHVCHDSRPEGFVNTEVNDESMAKYKALLKQFEGEN